MTEQVIEQNGAETATAETAAPAPQPELNINDLIAMRNLIDVVTQRGAFKANELSSVGVLFDKLNSFVDAAQKTQQAQQEQQTTGE
jgi:hypothetical protein